MALTEKDQVRNHFSFCVIIFCNINCAKGFQFQPHLTLAPTHYHQTSKFLFLNYEGEDITIKIEYYQDIKDVSVIFETQVVEIQKVISVLKNNFLHFQTK